MKRAAAYIFLLLLFSAIAVLAAISWLVGTNAGARWALESITRHSPVKISAAAVSGKIWGDLHLRGVTVRSGLKSASVASVDFRWQPAWLMTGRLMVDELVLSAVIVRDETPRVKKPVDLSLPRLPGLAELVDMEVDRLRITRLTYGRNGAKPVKVEELKGSVIWRDGTLTLPTLEVAAPEWRVKGSVAAGLKRPSLAANLEIVPTRAAGGMTGFSLSGRLLPGRGAEHLAGRLALTGREKGVSRLEAQSELGVERQGVKFRRLRLTRPGSGGVIGGNGSVNLGGPEPQVRIALTLERLDLVRELKRKTDLSGNLSLAGSARSYRGSFRLANRGKDWQEASLAATFRGGATGIELAPLHGALLGGTLSGNLELGWVGGISAKGRLKGEDMDPARLAKDWQGAVNFDGVVDVAVAKGGEAQGKVDVVLLQSRLHGQPLTGGVRGTFAGKAVQIEALDLHGKGFDLHGAGDLARRFDFSAVVTDLSRLVPDTAGEVRLAGWGLWREGRGAGAFSGAGRRLKGRGMSLQAVQLEGSMPWGKDPALHLAALLQKPAYSGFQADTVRLDLNGKLSDHRLALDITAPEANLALAASGGYKGGGWQGKIQRLSGGDRFGPWSLRAPAGLQVSGMKLSLAPLALIGVGGEHLEAAAEFSPGPATGNLDLHWERLNLNRITPWLQGVRVAGQSYGTVSLNLLADKRLSFAVDAGGTGTVSRDGRTVTIERADLKSIGGEKGIEAVVSVRGAEGIELEGKIATASPASLSMPDQGTMDLHWKVADLGVLEPWMKGGIKVAGALQGGAKGSFLPENRVSLSGNVTLSGGNLHWRKPEGEGTMALKEAAVKWSWQGDTLRGNVGLTLGEFGQAQGNFTLPVPAAFPVAPHPQGPVSAKLSGLIREQGVLSAMLPGLVQETHGLAAMDLGVGGVWQEPRLTGTLQLSQAGAYVPSAGIRLQDVTLAANLDRDRVAVSLHAASGSGRLEAEGLAQMQGWQVTGYRGTISGDNFQLLHLPELEATGSPRLSFQGTTTALAVRGEVRLPVLLVHGQPPKASVQPSEDVILEGAPPAQKASPLALDVQVRVILGDRVLVKAAGLDAKLGGSMDLRFTRLDTMASTGEIKVVKGRYKAYGLDLAIARGRIFYAGGPVNEPLLDILALRTAGEVRAGVTVTGTPRAPVIKLYSEPAMPDMDILAYMVLGHPLGQSSEQAGLVAQAAGLLLSTGQSVVLQDQIKNRLGLSTIEIESGRQDAAARMGYKAIPVTPSGMAPAKEAEGGVSESILTLGKYLTPQLYISYGRSIFTGANLFRLRYDISRRLQLETETGSESGVDLYYKMNFN